MMQERKNKVRLVSLILLLGLTICFYFFGSPNTGNDVDKSIFKVDDLTTINKVVLKSPQREVTLNYDGVRWRVNENYVADTRMITILFATLDQATPRRKVARNQQAVIESRMNAEGVEISLFQGEELVRRFTSIGNEGKTEAYFIDENQVPYVMTIPGYRVYVGGIFEMPSFDWREKRIFNFNWRNFKSLTATFPETPQQNFTIERINDVFGITGLEKTDTTKLNDYLDVVSLVEANQFVESSKQYDSLLNGQPMLQLQVNDIADRSYRLDIFASDNANRYLGKIEDGSLLVLSKQRLEPLARRREYFVSK